jgi:hypothetical protein
MYHISVPLELTEYDTAEGSISEVSGETFA